jgi:hypothetical protein
MLNFVFFSCLLTSFQDIDPAAFQSSIAPVAVCLISHESAAYTTTSKSRPAGTTMGGTNQAFNQAFIVCILC